MKNINWALVVDKLLNSLMLSQGELAKLCNVSQQSVSNWKNGKREPEVFAKRQLLKIFQENSFRLYPSSIESTENKYQSAADPSTEYTTSRGENEKEVSEFFDIFDKIPSNKRRELVEISKRKSIEEELRKSEQKYRLLAETTRDLISTLSISSLRFAYVSPAVRHFLGYSPEELKGRELYEFIHPDDRSVVREFHKSLSKRSTVRPVSYRMLTAKGGHMWVETNSSFMKLKKNRSIDEIVTVTRDISERKKYENSLKAEEERFRLVAENSADVIYVLSTDLLNLYISPSFRNLTGKAPKAALGRTHIETASPEDRKYLEKNLERVVRKKHSCRCEYKIPSKNGSDVWVETIFRYVQGFINEYHDVIIGVSRNITEHKNTEAELEFREELLNTSTQAASMLLSDVSLSVIRKTLRLFAETLDVQSASYFEYKPNSRVWAKRLYSVNRGKTSTLEKKSFLSSHPSAFKRWENFLDKKRPLKGNSDKFPEMERRVLKKYGVKSLLIIPVNSGRQLTGFVYFQNFERERMWKNLVLSVLKSYADSLASFYKRKNMRESLKDNEIKFRVVAEMAPVMMWMTDADMNTVYANKKAFDFAGIKNIKRFSWEKRVHPEDVRDVRDALEKSAHLGRKFKVEYRVARADGKYRWVIDFGAPRYSVDKEFAGFIGACVDITERKLSEEMLRESEQKINLIMKASSTGIWEYDVRENALKICGNTSILTNIYPSNSPLSPEDIKDRFHPDDFVELKKTVARHLSSAYNQLRVNVRVKNINGAWKWVGVNGKVSARSKSGNPLSVIGTIHDVTEEKQAEILARKNAVRYRELFNTMSEGVIVLDSRKSSRGNIFLVSDINRSAMKMIGQKSKKELSGRSLKSIFSGKPNSLLSNTLKDIRGTGKHRKLQAEEYRFKKETLFLEANLYSLKSGEIVLIFRNVTVQHEDEEALKELGQKYKVVLKSTNDGVLVVDPDSGSIVEANFNIRKILDCGKYRALGMKYKDIFATPPSADEDPVAEALKNGPRHGMETTLRALNGQKIRAEISAVPLVVDNKKMVVLAINDISEKERLSRLNKDISRISESNLKSRLDYILDVSAKLKKEMKKLTPRHAEMFDMLERAGKDMMNTIEMSLELGRAEDGALRLYRHKIETEELITEIIKEQKCLLKKKTPEFSLKKDSGDIDIKADKFMFYSMFSGLIKAVLKTVAPENTVLINIKKKRDTLEIKIAAKTSKPVSIPDSSCLIAEEHEGSVNAVFSPRDGSVVTLILPEK